jgi:alpha-N-arabinofuranosidase
MSLTELAAPRSAERAIQITAGLIDLARAENGVSPSVKRHTICFDEWNVWDPIRAEGESGAEAKYDLSDALAVGIWLNVFIRQAKYIGMANIAQTVNVISPLMTNKDGIIKQTTWWPLLLFSKFMRGASLACNVRCGEYQGDTEPAWIRSAIETPWLDVSAALGGDGFVNLMVVNVHESRDFETEVIGMLAATKEIEVHTVTSTNVRDSNMEGRQNVGIVEESWDGKGYFTFGKHSLTLLRWRNTQQDN